MPLIIACIIFLALIVVLRDHNVNTNQSIANYTKNGRKTNARLERMIVDKQMRLGLTFDEAYDEAQKKIIEQGFEPCIPRSAYGQGQFGKRVIDQSWETSFVYDPEQYDSQLVKSRRESLQRLSGNVSDADLYKDFPQSYAEYINDNKRLAATWRTYQRGEWFTHPKYGTVEVIDYHFGPFAGHGSYSVKVIKTGQIVHGISIDDPGIRSLK